MITTQHAVLAAPAQTGEYITWPVYGVEISPPTTYLEQPEVVDIMRWRQDMAYAIGVLAAGGKVAHLLPGLSFEHARIQREMKITGHAIGEQVLNVFCNAPFEPDVLELAGRTKKFDSVFGKVKRREDTCSEDEISDLYAYMARVPNYVVPRRVLEYMCQEFGVAPVDRKGRPVISPLANNASDPRFKQQGILQAKLHTAVGGRQVPFEIIVLTRHQSKVYNKTRHNFVSTRERDQEALQLMDTLNRMLPS